MCSDEGLTSIVANVNVLSHFAYSQNAENNVRQHSIKNEKVCTWRRLGWWMAQTA